MRYVTFSFDDGIRASTIKTAQIYESFGLRAELNVTAAFAAFGDAVAVNPDDRGQDYADFMLLNELQERGHVIQPHGYNHTDRTKVTLSVAKDLVARYIEVFRDHLKGFEPAQAVFCFLYNASNEAVKTSSRTPTDCLGCDTGSRVYLAEEPVPAVR